VKIEKKLNNRIEDEDEDGFEDDWSRRKGVTRRGSIRDCPGGSPSLAIVFIIVLDFLKACGLHFAQTNNFLGASSFREAPHEQAT